MPNEIDPDGVTYVPTELLQSPHLTAESKLIYVILAAYPEDVDVSVDRLESFAVRHGLTKAILTAALIELTTLRWIEIVNLNNDPFAHVQFARVLHRP